MTQSFNDISTIAALSKVIEIRQFGLEEDFTYLAEQPEVQELNERVLKATGIDLLNERIPLHLDGIEKCEAFLERLIDNAMAKKYSESYLNDEINILELTRDVPLNDFRSFNIGLASISPEVKKIFKAMGIIAPSIPRIIKDAYYVQEMAGKSSQFFAVSRVEIKSKIVLILFHINITAAGFADLKSPQKVAGGRFSVDMPKDFSSFSATDENEVPRVNVCFLFKESNIHLSPVRMFLRGISKYGVPLTINNSTQKIFLEVISSSLSIMQGNRLVFDNNTLTNDIKNLVLYHGLELTSSGTINRFIFAFNEQELITDATRLSLL